MRYKILHTESDSLLEQLVNDHISEGWQPLGGVSAVRWEYEREGYTNVVWEYVQALIKPEIPTPLMDAYERSLKEAVG